MWKVCLISNLAHERNVIDGDAHDAQNIDDQLCQRKWKNITVFGLAGKYFTRSKHPINSSSIFFDVAIAASLLLACCLLLVSLFSLSPLLSSPSFLLHSSQSVHSVHISHSTLSHLRARSHHQQSTSKLLTRVSTPLVTFRSFHLSN